MKLAGIISFFAAFLSHTYAQGNLMYTEPNCNGRQVVVQLFEWSWDSIADECEKVLGPLGFCGLQTSPPAEHITAGEWWARYQPVSYKLDSSRSGNRAQFQSMVQRCNAAGVNVIVDFVVNQMAGGSGKGTGGTDHNAGTFSYPGVPYSSLDFNDYRCEIDYGDAWSIRNCALLGMSDLNQGKEYVREKIAEYANDLLRMGVKGFRFDASKHMYPGDLEAIVAKFENTIDGNRPLVYHEVIDYRSEPVRMEEYFNAGKVTEFRYGSQMTCIRGRDWHCLDGFAKNFIDGLHAIVFLDNHDTQRHSDVVTFWEDYNYKLASGYHLAHDYGFKRIMSSYRYDYADQGPPGVQPQPAPQACGNNWVCEHRWSSIGNMVQFANACSGSPISIYDIKGGALGIGRSGKGFAVIGEAVNTEFYTGMPDGEYCDLVSIRNGVCNQKVYVRNGGYATFSKYQNNDPVVAICVGCS